MTKVLLGFMGVGKSTVSKELDQNYRDMDAIIEERVGMPIASFFDQYGETAFRNIESQVLADLLSEPDDLVIATGGGVVLSKENRRLLAANRHQNILLVASFEVLYHGYKRILKLKDLFLATIPKKLSITFIKSVWLSMKV